MKEINRGTSFYIITSLLSAALLFPVFFQNAAEETVVFNEQTISSSILRSIPLLALLLFVSLYGSGDDRRSRGWKKPTGSEILMIPVLLAVTAVLSLIFPASEDSYSVELQGIRSVIPVLLFSFITASSEELFFRSWLISGFRETSLHPWIVFSLPVLFFSSLHIWQGWGGFFFSFFSAGVYTLYFMRRPALFTLIISHTVHNSLALLLMSGR